MCDFLYRNIVSYIPLIDQPIVSRMSLKTYVQIKIDRLQAKPMLVDVLWHAPMFCSRYCVCKVASNIDRIEYYNKRLCINCN